MAERTVIPFGPQHPVLPEPIHLDLVIEDERVVEAIPSIGYIHRGLEKLVEKKDYQEYVYVAERICGICSFMHGMGYCMAVEKLLGLTLSSRAEYLRVIWAELSRIHSHLLWLGLLADGFGYENLFMQSWRLRETVLDIFDMTTGGRIIFSVCKIGGLRRDMEADMLARVADKLAALEEALLGLTTAFLRDSSVQHRLRGVGIMTAEDAAALGAVGPMARASGLKLDMRLTGYSIYRELEFAPVTREEGDCYARCAVRLDEVYQSIRLIRQCIAQIPDGPVDQKVTGNPDGEYFARLEQPRGEVIYYARGNGTKFLDRMRVRTPTFANLPALIHTLKDCSLADVPMLVLTIDPCISCTER